MDKLAKVREWIKTRKLCTMDEHMNFYCKEAESDYNMLSRIEEVIDSLQEEHVSERFTFKAIPRLLEMIEPTDRAKAYITKLADILEVEGYSTDAKIVRESLKIMNGEKVPMATMDEEYSSDAPFIEIPFGRDSELIEESICIPDGCYAVIESNKVVIRKGKEPVSEDLEYASEKYACRFSSSKYGHDKVKNTFIAGAKWKEEQFEKERLKHCDELTAEQAKIESDFVTQHLKKNSRTPTFIDAIEHGMRLQAEQMMAKAKGGTVQKDYQIIMDDGTWIDLDPSMQLKPAFNVNVNDKVKVIVTKED